jgi:hypothetical protein
VLSDAALERLRDGAWATPGLAIALGTTSVLRYSVAGRAGAVVAAFIVVLLGASVGAPLWLRGPGEAAVQLPGRVLATPGDPRTGRPRVTQPLRVRLYALDGASLGFIRQRVAAGELPNFGRILDRGATADLRTIRPTQAEPVWAAAATGKWPQMNGVRSSGSYRVDERDTSVVDVLPDFCFAYALVNQGFVRADSLSSEALAARPVWAILADYGVTSGVAGWPLTYPARAERGFVVSDQFDEAASSPLRLADARAGDPTTAIDVAREIFDVWQDRPAHAILPSLPKTGSDPTGLVRARWDRAYAQTAAALEEQFAPRFAAVRYEGLDAFGHIYLADAQPERFGERRRVDPSRSVLDQYYDIIDREIGDAMRRLGATDLLLVVSSFGMEPTSPTKRLLARLLSSPDLAGTHEGAPDGFMLAYGSAVAPGQVDRGSVVDVAPTVLYYMGVDVGRDMDGVARTDLFSSTFVFEHPVKYVATHER